MFYITRNNKFGVSLFFGALLGMLFMMSANDILRGLITAFFVMYLFEVYFGLNEELGSEANARHGVLNDPFLILNLFILFIPLVFGLISTIILLAVGPLKQSAFVVGMACTVSSYTLFQVLLWLASHISAKH